MGAAGFPNGEAQKSNFPYPHYNTSRLFLRQTFGFGGEQEKLGELGATQLAGKVDVSRLTVQAGKFAVVDVFDGNAYAKDTRTDFMNWSMWAPGAMDYSADKVGLSYGATAELNQKHWALRTAISWRSRSRTPTASTATSLERGMYIAELETRYQLFSQPGKLRTIAWINSVNSGSYRDTLNNPAFDLDISLTRTGRTKYGYVISVEQAVTDDIGLFGRWSWNDGKTEIMAFTDIDASLSLGTSIKGTKWGRPDDVIGLGGAINALSRDHRDFHRRRRARRPDRRRRAQLPARADPRDLLCLRAHQGADADRGLSADHQPRLQRRPRPGACDLGQIPRGVLGLSSLPGAQLLTCAGTHTPRLIGSAMEANALFQQQAPVVMGPCCHLRLTGRRPVLLPRTSICFSR